MCRLFTILFVLFLAQPVWAVTATIGDNSGDTYSGSEDVSLTQAVPDTNRDASAFWIRKVAVGDHDNAVLRFTGLSSITSPVTVTSATLYLYLNSAASSSPTSLTINVRRLLRDWVETQATWNSYSTGNAWTTAGALSDGNDRVATISGTGDPGSTDGYKAFTGAGMATDVQGWINGTLSNYGWVLERSDAGDDGVGHKFYRSEDSDAFRPYLDITYTVGGGSTTRRRVVSQ